MYHPRVRILPPAVIPLIGLLAGLASAQTLPPLTSFTPGECAATPLPSANTAGGSYGACSLVAQTSEDSVSGLLGVKLYATNGSFEVSSLGVGGDFGMVLQAFGGVDGVPDGVPTASYTGAIPVSWNFTPTSSDGSNLAFELFFEFYPAGAAPLVLDEGNINDFDIASGTNVSGTDSISIPDIGITSFSISLDVAGQSSASDIVVSIPQNSIDIAPSAPEPASILLLGSGLAVISLMRWRRARR